jgi:hypothetical protein
MKKKSAKANVHPNLETMQHDREILEASEKSVQLGKIIFKKESQTASKFIEAKEQQDIIVRIWAEKFSGS